MLFLPSLSSSGPNHMRIRMGNRTRQYVRKIVLRVDAIFFILQRILFPSDLQPIVRRFVREILRVDIWCLWHFDFLLPSGRVDAKTGCACLHACPATLLVRIDRIVLRRLHSLDFESLPRPGRDSPIVKHYS
jgi:hypothetical protein